MCFLELLLSAFFFCNATILYYHVQACGAKYHLQEEDLDETDVDDVVVALVNMARRVSFALFLWFFNLTMLSNTSPFALRIITTLFSCQWNFLLIFKEYYGPCLCANFFLCCLTPRIPSLFHTLNCSLFL